MRAGVEGLREQVSRGEVPMRLEMPQPKTGTPGFGYMVFGYVVVWLYFGSMVNDQSYFSTV